MSITMYLCPPKGFYFSDVKNDIAHVMINTVDSIKNKYTVKEYDNAPKACSLQDIIGRPATKDYIEYVQKSLIPNCMITKRDILRSGDILGLNLGSLKAKTTQKITRESNT